MRILIIGASIRAAAESARRTGWLPTGIDLFADRDTRAIAQVRRIAPTEYPLGILSLSEDLPECPWFYTGAIENYPGLIDELARRRPLWGNPGDVVRSCRDPFRLSRIFQEEGIIFPRVSREAPSRDLNRWLVKPISSAGGQEIHSACTIDGKTIPQGFYFEERISGHACSAVYLGSRQGACELLGVSRQLLGRPGARFAYRGNIGPYILADHLRAQLVQIGEALLRRCGLLGLFGVDFVVCGNQAIPIEVNPRYTASIEVHELASGQSFLSYHRSVFEADSPTRASGLLDGFERRLPASNPGIVVKYVLYARHATRFRLADYLPGTDLNSDSKSLRPIDSWDLDPTNPMTRLSDIPAEGESIRPGDPIVTLLVKSGNQADCLEHLRHWITGQPWRDHAEGFKI